MSLLRCTLPSYTEGQYGLQKEKEEEKGKRERGGECKWKEMVLTNKNVLVQVQDNRILK